MRLAAIAIGLIGVALIILSFVDKAHSSTAIASVYGEELRGSPTASGEPFDPDGYTAASKTLPLGTRLLVKHEGRGVTLTINDRGPFIAGRDLDISKGAAKAIGLYDEGVGEVQVEQVSSPTPSSSAPELPKTGVGHE